MRVLRIFHSAVVDAWRERERQLISAGVDVCLLSANRWDEGGREVALHPGSDVFVTGADTIGAHPNVFVFDPRPLWRLLGQDWDLVDIHEEPCSLVTLQVMAMMALRRRVVPIVLYSAQNIDKRYPAPFRWIERVALRRAAAVSACNNSAARIVRRKGLVGPVKVVGLGVDTSQFSPAERDAPTGGLRIGYFGRLERHKGVDTLIRAVAEDERLTATLVGSGPHEQALRDLIASLGVSDRVVLRGFVSASQLPELYRDVDVAVVPSIATPAWEEQFGRVVIEAMASGVPVVAARTGALPEVVADAGLLFSAGDHVELRTVLDTLARDPDQWRCLRQAGLRRAEEFRWSAVARQQKQLYEEAIAATPAAAPPVEHGPPSGRQLHIVVVAYGSPELLEACLRPLAGRFPIVIVDNSSLAETRQLAADLSASYLDPGRNLGFAAGVNRGLAAVGPDADVLLLNPDATVSAEAIATLREHLYSRPRLAAVSPVQRDPATGELARVEWPFPSPAVAWAQAAGLARLHKNKRDFAIGSVLMLRAEAIADVGGFDERYFLYAEEVDWQRRATQMGWQISVTDAVLAEHIGAGTGGDPTRRETHFHASHEIYIRKHFGAIGWQSYRTAVIAGALVRTALGRGGRSDASRLRLKLYVKGPFKCQEQLVSQQ